jgi:uncharacterized membrane protein YfcA
MNHPILQILFFLCATFVPSLLGALSGIGGGIIIKPVLDTFYQGKPEEINFLSGCTVLFMSFVSLVQRRLGGSRFEDRRGIALAVGAVLGGITGRMVFSLALSGMGDSKGVRIAQSGILLFLTVLVWLSMLRKVERTIPRDMGSHFFPALIGCILGMISSFLGIGGGPINIMVLSLFLGMDIKTAGLYSLLTIFFSQLASIGQGFISASTPELSLSTLIVMVCGGVMGGLAGSRLLPKMKEKQVKILFFCILWLVILLSGYNLLRFLFDFAGDLTL